MTEAVVTTVMLVMSGRRHVRWMLRRDSSCPNIKQIIFNHVLQACIHKAQVCENVFI